MIRRLRVLTLNIHKGLSHFNRRVVIHDLREGLHALDPDLVFLQEVQGLNDRHALRFAGWPGAPQHEFLAAERWQHAYGRSRVYEHGHHGNALLSRFPILSAETQDISHHRFESRGLLHAVVKVPGWRRNLHCVCVHLSLHERGRRRQLDAIAERLAALIEAEAPIIIAGDFNDWRERATRVLESALGMTEVSFAAAGRHARTWPSLLPLLRLDRIYVRGFEVLASHVHRGAPWSLLSDHLALGAELALARRLRPPRTPTHAG
jgi:endonuclease/exonuclease/phosphatase family metal-dependent hydrolase